MSVQLKLRLAPRLGISCSFWSMKPPSESLTDPHHGAIPVPAQPSHCLGHVTAALRSFCNINGGFYLCWVDAINPMTTALITRAGIRRDRWVRGGGARIG